MVFAHALGYGEESLTMLPRFLLPLRHCSVPAARQLHRRRNMATNNLRIMASKQGSTVDILSGGIPDKETFYPSGCPFE
jgi:hypothetical protein